MYKKIIYNKFYYKINNKLINKINLIKLLVCDVDGVLSDGMIYLGNNGEEFKSFNVKDGYGIKKLINKNIKVAVITGSFSKIINRRCNFLGINHIYQNSKNKLNTLNILLKKLNLKNNQVAYIGDDLIDIEVMKKIGLSIAVYDSHPFLKKYANYITKNYGGKGAVREVCDLILLTQKQLLKK